MILVSKQLGRVLVMTLALGVASAQPARAGEAESLETLRQTTLNLIQLLVEQGVLSPEKAESLMRAAEQKAAQSQQLRKSETLAEGEERIRVPYVPEPVRKEIQAEIRKEVLAQAKSEGWAQPGVMPEWLERFTWEADARLRLQLDRLDSNNSAPVDFAVAALSGTTRAPDFSATTGGVAGANTLDDRDRLRVRARLGVMGKVSDSWSAGLRLTTGNITDRVSTNQTLGQDFNKYTAVWDRVFLQYAPAPWITATGGRIPNPFFSTDLVYHEDLGFEGLAVSLKPDVGLPTLHPFLTLGSFPVREDNPPAASSRWIHGAQAGAQWDASPNIRLKLALAYYALRNFEGEVETPGSFILGIGPATAEYGRYEYGRNLRQRGNTLFRTNSINDGGATIWGLASKFTELNLTASLELAHFDPVRVTLLADYVKNTAFDRNEIRRRTGLLLTDGKDHGYLYRLTAGTGEIRKRHDWQVSAAYRYLGSDAVIDGFTNSDFNLGGTNNKGYVLGFAYGIDRNVTFGMRWLSADSIDSPTLVPGGRYSVDVLQADVNVRF